MDRNFQPEKEQTAYTKQWLETGQGCICCADGKPVFLNPMTGFWEHDKQHQLGEPVYCIRVNWMSYETTKLLCVFSLVCFILYLKYRS